MAANKPIDYMLVDLTYCEPTSTEPAGEMFGDLHVGLSSRHRIAACLQIESEQLEDYAQMAGGLAALNEGAKE